VPPRAATARLGGVGVRPRGTVCGPGCQTRRAITTRSDPTRFYRDYDRLRGICAAQTDLEEPWTTVKRTMPRRWEGTAAEGLIAAAFWAAVDHLL
jgi:hypothetical protein